MKYLKILAFILLDLAIYIIIGLIILGYEDFYSEEKGPYWSLQSMTLIQKIAYIGYYIWFVLNFLMIGYFIFKFLKGKFK